MANLSQKHVYSKNRNVGLGVGSAGAKPVFTRLPALLPRMGVWRVLLPAAGDREEAVCLVTPEFFASGHQQVIAFCGPLFEHLVHWAPLSNFNADDGIVICQGGAVDLLST